MNLLSPGPVKVIDQINQAQTREMITHRSQAFTELYTDLVTRLKKYFSSHESYVFTGSGSLGLEGLLLNTCFPEDKVLCFTNGVFGDHMCAEAELYAEVQKETSYPSNSQDVVKSWTLKMAKQLIDESNAQVLAIVQNETGYAIRNDVKEICNYAKKKGLYTIVDGISAWPGTRMDMKEFGIDGFVTASQKGIGCPPGMALLGVSKELSERINSRDKIPNRYCDLRKHKQRFEKDGQTPNTPAISLFYSLQKAFDVLDNERGGLEKTARTHKELGEYVRKRLIEIGFELIAEPGYESHTVTGFKVENAKKIKKELFDKGTFIVGCKGVFAENGLRIGHMVFDPDKPSGIDICLDLLEKIKKKKLGKI